MTDNLRDRIIAAIAQADQDWCSDTPLHEDMADAVIAELGRRRCERCRIEWPLNRFPPPHEGSDVMRPYCEFCTEYIKWATS